MPEGASGRLDPAAIGTESDTFAHRYGARDLALYALSVGASVERDLDLVHGGARGPAALPTYAVVAAFPAVRDLQRKLGGSSAGLLHAAQRIRLHRPLAPAGRLRTRARVAGIHDLRRFAQSTLVARTDGEDGQLAVETEWTVFHTRDAAPGADPPPRRPSTRPPPRPADRVVRHPVSPDQAALYRLNGDDNPLHIDPAAAAAAGFDRPILHGLCTLGMSCLALRRAGVDLARLRCLEAQFRAPAFPGDLLAIEIWAEPSRWMLRATAELRPEAPVLLGAAELG